MVYIYFLAMIIVYVIAYIGSNSKYRSTGFSIGSICVIIAVLVFISGFRSGIGDTFFYKHTYNLLVENPDIHIKDKDLGFTYFMILLTSISKNPQILVFLTSLVTNMIIIITLYKYAKPLELGVFLYFGTLMYYVTMNGIRQSLVSSVLFCAVSFIIKKDWIKYFILILLLSTFHQSALIFLPLYFLVRREAWSKSFWAVLGVTVVLVIAFRPMLGTISSLLENTSYSNYGQDMLSNTETVNFIRVLISAVPLVLAYLVKDRVKSEWPESSIFIYMSLFNFIFMLLGTQYLYFYRLCIYFDLFNLILIPRLIYFYGKQKGLTLYIYVIALYTIFSWYQVSLWNENYRNILFK